MATSTRHRLDANAELSGLLAKQSDEELISLIEQGKAKQGWGTTRTVDAGTGKVFCKCIPLTELQAENPYSTANLHSLPTFYNYGVGSAGFSPFRELEVHRRTTAWVWNGDTVHFPLLHHHRILPLAAQGRRVEGDRLDRYVKFWDGDKKIRSYIEARNGSMNALVTFVEWVPATLQTWLGQNQHRIGDVIDQIDRAISLLRTNGIVHFDANPSNIVTDGTTMLLTDFGLALDETFELQAAERSFLADHHHFDHGEFLTCLDLPLHELTETWDDDTKAFMAERYGDGGPGALLNNLEAVLADGIIAIDPVYVNALLRYRPVITAMAAVFERISSGPKDAGGYDDDVLKRLLTKTDSLT